MAAPYLTDDRLGRIGHTCAALLRRDASWIERRREAITLLDETALRHRITVDFVLPTDLGDDCPLTVEDANPESIYCAPLFVLPKASGNLMSFDLVDEAERSLPLMTRVDNARISGETMVSLAGLVLNDAGGQLAPELAEDVRAIATADPGEAQARLDRLRRPLATDDHQPERELLCGDARFSWWLRTVAIGSIVVVLYPDAACRRRIFKLSFQEDIVYELPGVGRLGWSPYRGVVDSLWIDGRNYHVEVEAPHGLRIARATLADDERDEPVEDTGFLRRAHLYRPNSEAAGAATTTIGLLVSGPGFVGGGLLATILVLAATGGCFFFTDEVASNPTSAPALLLALPGLVASYVGRPGQHALTTRLLSFARWVLLAAGFVAYLCAARIALSGPTPTDDPGIDAKAKSLECFFGIAAGVAALRFVALLISWLAAHRRVRSAVRMAWLTQPLKDLPRTRVLQSVSVRAHPDALFNRVAPDEAGFFDSSYRLLALGAGDRRVVATRRAWSGAWVLEARVQPAPEGAIVTLTADYLQKPLWTPLRPWLVRRESRCLAERVRELAADAAED